MKFQTQIPSLFLHEYRKMITKCSKDCRPKTSIFLLDKEHLTYARAIKSAKQKKDKPPISEDLFGNESQQRGDQFWLGETAIWKGPNPIGRIFTNHYSNATSDWWRESWITFDFVNFREAPQLRMSYVGANTDADSFVYGYKQNNPGATLHRMDVDFIYETFDPGAAPVSLLPQNTPAGITNVVYRVKNSVGGGPTSPQGVLFRQFLYPNPNLQVRFDHWVLYATYQMPQPGNNVSTHLELDAALNYGSPHEFGQNAQALAAADGAVAQWFVRTQAAFSQV